MMKKLVVLIACFGALHLSGCTSNDNKSDAEVTSDFDSADLEKLDGEETADVAGDSSLGSDQLPEDALGETTSTTTTVETTTTHEAPAPEVHDDQMHASAADMPADPFAESVESTPPPTETPAVAESTMPSEPSISESTHTETTTSTTYVDEGEKPKKKKSSGGAPLQKVATAPWKVGKTWYNTVYFARPGDSLSSISTMIYGKNKVSELKKGNSTFASRGVKPGDKVYYNSPHRSDDSGRMLTYYEDNGIAPETYVAKDGDDIKKVSKELLGYKDAWKEVWASNSVDSKTAIAAGTELRYWKGGPVAAPAMPPEVHHELAANPPGEMPPPQMDQQMPPPGEMPPPPPPDMAAQEMAPPPPPPGEMPQEMAPPPPPPPDMAQEMAPPPPPPPPVEAVNPPAPPHHDVAAEESGNPLHGMDNDTTLALAVVGLAAAGLAILIVIRKKRRQKELEQQIDNTHVG